MWEPLSQEKKMLMEKKFVYRGKLILLLPWEVKNIISSQEKYIQETMSFEHTMDSFKKIIIVEKNMKPRYDENGYLMMGVQELLLDANSLLI